MTQPKAKPIYRYVKVSCSALLISSTLFGYGAFQTAHAKDSDTSVNISQNQDNDLNDKVKDAKQKIAKLKHLTAETKTNYTERLDKANNKQTIDNIIQEAKDDNKEGKATASSQKDTKNEDASVDTKDTEKSATQETDDEARTSAQDSERDLNNESDASVTNKDNDEAEQENSDSSSSNATTNATQDDKSAEDQDADNTNDTSATNKDDTTKRLDQFLVDLNRVNDKVNSAQPSAENTNDNNQSQETTEENKTDEQNGQTSTDNQSDQNTQSADSNTGTDTSDNSSSQKDGADQDDRLDDLLSALKQDNQDNDADHANDTSDKTADALQNDKQSDADADSNNDNIAADSNDNEETANNQDHASFLKTLKDLENDDTNTQANALTDHLQGSDKINQSVATQVLQGDSNNQDTTTYVQDKIKRLNDLNQNIKDDQALANTDKQQLQQQVEQVASQMKQQHQLLLNRLAETQDKSAAVKDIVNSVFSQNEAQRILKDIDTSGKSDQQIANQLSRYIDQLSTTNSDDILKSMLDQSKDPAELIRQILTTKLGDNEARQIAKQLVNSDLSHAQIVDQLKRHFIASGQATADDILNEVINQSNDKKQAIATLLGTRLEQGKAQMLADVINRMSNDKNNALNLVKSAFNGKANDLLQLQQRANQARNNLDYVLSPIKDRPNLLQRLNANGAGNDNNGIGNLLNNGSSMLGNTPGLLGGSGLLSGLLSGPSLLDGIDDLPTPAPENGLSLGTGDGLLGGLFNDDGNISLPNTGQAIKNNWAPIAITLAVIGGGLVLIGQRRKHAKANK